MAQEAAIRHEVLAVSVSVAVAWLAGLCVACATTHPAVSQGPDYERRDQPVDQNDLLILERADAILATADVWNRADDRKCAEGATVWSLFCALQKASVEVAGEYQHRRVGLQEVRFAVEEATKGRELEHRMMDFNNLPETTFADIKRVLAVAMARVRARLESQRPQP